MLESHQSQNYMNTVLLRYGTWYTQVKTFFVFHSQSLHDDTDWFKYVPRILSHSLIQLLFTGSSYLFSLEPFIVCLCIYGHTGNINLDILPNSDMNLNFNFSFLLDGCGYYISLVCLILYFKLPFL